MLDEATAGKLTGFSGVTMMQGGEFTRYQVGQCAAKPFETAAALGRLAERING